MNRVVKRNSWSAKGWHGLWTKWSEIPYEFRALLIWAFLTSGPTERDEYFKIMLAMEQWDHSRLSVFQELEIRWMTEKIEQKCPEMKNEILDQGIVLYLNIGLSNSTLKSRRSPNTPKIKDLTMIRSLNLNSEKLQNSWEWMQDWYVANPHKESTLGFEEWFSVEINRINQWEEDWANAFPDSVNRPFNGEFPFLHQGRSFPIDNSGTEVQKTIRLVRKGQRMATAWGYILRTPEPEIPHDPFPYFPPMADPEWYRRFLSQDFIHGQTAFVGGPTGLVDFAHEMREAERILRMPKRKESPMSKIMLN